jgi:hypothetical protein
MTIVPAMLKAFLGLWDADGYNDNLITDDLITDLFVSFGDQTRNLELQDLLRTLSGMYHAVDGWVTHTYCLDQPYVSHSITPSRLRQRQ